VTKKSDTSELIRRLSTGLEPVRPMESEVGFYLKCLLGLVPLLLAFGMILPMRDDLGAKFNQPGFLLETLLWLGFTGVGAGVVYRSAIPGLPTRRAIGLGMAILLALAAVIFLRLPTELAHEGFREQLREEMDLYRGRCGPIILIIATMSSTGLYAWSRKTAPVNRPQTGAWIALTSGALGSFLMQFACAHDNSLHLLIWHFVPIFALAFLSTQVARVLLRW
jgi:hypothetical protein